MASDYGLNFGFRRSDESVRVSEGRVRTPATGANLLLGTAVEINPAAPDFLRVAAANAKARTGICGLLLQEEVWDRTIYQSDRIDSFSLGVALKNRLSVITNGAGTKIWLKNTASQNRADGRSIAAVTMFAAGSVAVGAKLGWDGTKWVFVDGTTITNDFMEVTSYDASKGYLEAVLTH